MRLVSFHRTKVTVIVCVLAACLSAPASNALATTGFGPLSGENGCLVASGQSSSTLGTAQCGVGKGLLGAHAVAVSPDGANVYVVGGVAGNSVALSYGAIAILKRDPTTGTIAETGCLSSDGTDGRDGASGACTAEPSLLGASGVAVSPDGSTVFVASSSSASVVAFSRNPATGALTRLGCFQGTPRPGTPCGAADLFSSSSSLAVSADGNALYVAAPLAGAVSTLDTAASLRTPAGIVPALPPAAPAAGGAAGASTGTGAAGAAGGASGSGAAARSGLAAIFSPSVVGDELLNPCIAVNGLDGACAVSTATQSLGDLALSPDGKQLYAAAPASGAIDVFTPNATGALSETGCVKVNAPPGLCQAGAHMREPTELAVSPDGRNVYAADEIDQYGTGMLDVLSRDPGTGALSSSGCVEFAPKPEKPEPEEGEEESESAKGQTASRASAADTASGCSSAPGLNGVSVVAVSGDGSAVYAIGSGSAAIFSRDAASGQLTETSCAVANDERCTSLPELSGVTGAAVSPDGHQVYVVAAKSDAVTAFGIGAAVTTARTSATRAGTARVSVACPAGLRHACSGRVLLTHALARSARRGRRSRARRETVGSSGAFSIAPGRHASVRVRLTPAARGLLGRRRRLGLMAVVRANPAAGGSGYGRRLALSLRRH
ncbi:MAG TPA: hypothetical protein VK707_01155 [Solirubrobacteraceae bacterium]|jgi:DNA-binding beta-propeller fold protein YncE|nr:hypothetical protein [Solirubrobacteraceae bacterium]